MISLNCDLCKLHEYTKSPMIEGRGSVHPKLIIIGEAPGIDEVEADKAFVGRSGKKLDQLLGPELLKVTYVTNMVKCYPPNKKDEPEKGFRPPSDYEVMCCLPHLAYELGVLTVATPKRPLIMTLGNIALRGLIGDNEKIMRELGKVKEVSLWGFVYTVIPNYHPSFILRNPFREPEMVKVINQVKEILCQ